MQKEAKYLSKLVKKNLLEYDKLISTISATLWDGELACIFCEIACNLAIVGGCAAGCAFFGAFCGACLLILEYYDVLHLSCLLACKRAGCEEW